MPLTDAEKRMLAEKTRSDAIVYKRCPTCTSLPGMCEHLGRDGKIRRKKPEYAQQQKYALNPKWRGRTRGSHPAQDHSLEPTKK